MSWLELDDRLLEHPKFVRAVKLGGSETVHLWLGIRAYCGQNLSDGVVPADMIDEVRGPASPRKRARALEVLREVGLIEAAPDGGLMMHDFLQWSRSRAQILNDRDRARARQANRRGAHDVQALSRRDIPRDTRRDSEKTSGVVTRPSASASASGREDLPPPPQPEPAPEPAPRPRPRDPLAASLLPLDDDVRTVYERWRTTFGFTGAKLRGGGDLDAAVLREAIDLHGVPDCLAVLSVARDDAMVNGTADERGVKHESIRYLFDNGHTFARLHRAAQERARKAKPKQSFDERWKALLEANPEGGPADLAAKRAAAEAAKATS